MLSASTSSRPLRKPNLLSLGLELTSSYSSTPNHSVSASTPSKLGVPPFLIPSLPGALESSYIIKRPRKRSRSWSAWSRRWQKNNGRARTSMNRKRICTRMRRISKARTCDSRLLWGTDQGADRASDDHYWLDMMAEASGHSWSLGRGFISDSSVT
jgi:hypothetical protein